MRLPSSVRVASTLLTTALLLASGPPSHAGRGGIDVEHFRPNADGRGIFGTESATTFSQWQWDLGFVVHYAHNPFVFVNAASRAKVNEFVANRLTGSLTFGLGLTDWLELEALMPIVLANISRTGGNLQSDAQVSGFGSMWLQLKLRLLRQDKHGVGLAFLPAVSLPTGNHNAFTGQNFATFAPALLVERSWNRVRLLGNLGYVAREPAKFGNLTVDDELYWRAGLGVRVHDKWELGGELFGTTAATSPFGGDDRLNPFEWLLGAKFFPNNNWQIVFGGGAGLSRGYGAPQFRAFAGVYFGAREKDTDGDGLYDPQDRCPLVPGPRENQGCPWPDADGDGILDKDDKCPLVRGPKENHGCPWPDTDADGLIDPIDACPTVPGPRENRGCPWPDTDGDGTPDRFDACPTVPGPKENRGCPIVKPPPPPPPPPAPKDTDGDGILDPDDRCPTVPGPKANQGCPWPDRDKDGIADPFDDCPDQAGSSDNKGCPKKGVQKRRGELRILTPVFFKFGSAKILPKSFPILDDVAETLTKFKSVKLVEVQGHTDDVGSAKFNKKLSAKRAKSVRDYLIKKGIDGERLTSKGYGPDKPLQPIDKDEMTKAQLKAARSLNRRVQFIVLKEDREQAE